MPPRSPAARKSLRIWTPAAESWEPPLAQGVPPEWPSRQTRSPLQRPSPAPASCKTKTVLSPEMPDSLQRRHLVNSYTLGMRREQSLAVLRCRAGFGHSSFSTRRHPIMPRSLSSLLPKPWPPCFPRAPAGKESSRKGTVHQRCVRLSSISLA